MLWVLQDSPVSLKSFSSPARPHTFIYLCPCPPGFPQVLIDKTQEYCTGTVKVKLYKGTVVVMGRKSPYSLYDKVRLPVQCVASAIHARMLALPVFP